MNVFDRLTCAIVNTFSLRSALLLFVGWLSFSAVDSLRAAPVYRIQTSLSASGFKVGEEIHSWESLIIVSRPSPGDNFWYRLPHTVQVTGDLPPGIQLVQKGAGFHELAHFTGTPTQAGQFTVQVQATMADGLTTTQEAVTFIITDPRDDSYTVQTWGLTRLLQGKQVGNAGAFLVGQWQSLLKAPTKVQATGLPAGVTISESLAGYYSIQGAPEVAGKFSVTLAFSWPDGAPIAQTTADLEVLPSDYKPKQTLSVVVLGPIREKVSYAPHGYKAPFLYVEDEFGARSSEPLIITATGLPAGLSIDSQAPGSGFVVGRPTQTGTFATTFRATLPDGTVTNEVVASIEVLPAIPFTDLAGTYDSVVDRSESLNGNNGGRLRFTLTRGGQATGFIIHNLVRYPFSNAAFTFDPDTGDVTITPPGSGVTVSGSIALSDEYSSGSPQPYITFGGEVVNASSSAAVHGARATARSATNPSPYASDKRINLVFLNESSSAAGQPSGAGFLAASVSPVGNVTLTVWAPDGSAPVSLATTLSETSFGATFPVYFIVPNSSGSSTLSGQVFINSDGDAAGELTWYQSATNRGAFPDGISLIEYAGVIGSRHIHEPAGQNLLGLEESINTAQFDLIGEDVSAEPEAALTLQRSSMTVASTANVRAMKMRFDNKTGILTGSLTLPATNTSRARAVTFRGVRTPNDTGIIGHFTTPSSIKSTRRVAGMLMIDSAR